MEAHSVIYSVSVCTHTTENVSTRGSRYVFSAYMTCLSTSTVITSRSHGHPKCFSAVNGTQCLKTLTYKVSRSCGKTKPKHLERAKQKGLNPENKQDCYKTLRGQLVWTLLTQKKRMKNWGTESSANPTCFREA